MKEWGEGVISKAEYDFEKWKDHHIDKVGDYICSVCKCVWFPTIPEDVNTKRLSCYCKLCKKCRMKAFLKGKEYKAKHGNNYDKNRDGNASIINN